MAIDGSGFTASGFDIFTALDQIDRQTQIANAALGSGIDAFQKKEYARSAREFQRSISLDPSNPQAYNLLATAYLQQNKSGEAIKAYKLSLRIDSSQDSVHRSLAVIYLQDKKYSDAESEYKASIKLNATDTVAPFMLGEMYQELGRNAEAEAQFKKVIRMSPQDPNPYYALGALYNSEERFAEAVKPLQQAVKLRPKMTAAQFELGVAYAETGRSNDAGNQVHIVTRLDEAQGVLLKKTIAQPRMVAGGGGLTDNFASALEMRTDVGATLLGVDPVTHQEIQSKEFSITFTFDSQMDPQSVQDPNNWTITKATGGAAGYYNNLLPVLPTEAYIPQNPTRVVYDPENQQAVVTFLLSQNSSNDATIDPSHMVFKFTGRDVTGKSIDPGADEYDGYAGIPF